MLACYAYMLLNAVAQTDKIRVFVEAVAQWASTSGSLIAGEYQLKAKDVAVQLQRVLKVCLHL
jgi:hypothetical protein